MKKAVKCLVLILLLIAAALALFVLTRPSVWYVEGPVEAYAFPSPSPLSPYWKLSEKSPRLVIVTPMAEVPETGALTVLLGRHAEEEEQVSKEVLIDETAMWATALSSGVECLLYESSDAFCQSLALELMELDSNAYAVSYDGRITASDYGQLAEDTSEADRIFLLTPATAVYLARHTDKDLVVEFRDKAALEYTKARYTVSIDIDAMVRRFLSGDFELPYTLLASEE